MADKLQIGQLVIVTELIYCRRTGQTGLVAEYRPSKRKIPTLDKYVVKFSDGERVEFWAIQIKPLIDATRRKTA